jgi:hypothetical protein
VNGRHLERDQRWIVQAEVDIAKARADLLLDPGNRGLAALIRLGEQVIEHERTRSVTIDG